MSRAPSSGFTLVELLIVVVILGILAGVVVFGAGRLADDASDRACATERDQLRTAVEAYVAANPGAVRADLDDIAVLQGTNPVTGVPYVDGDPAGDFALTNGGVVARDPGRCAGV
jgi:general secretion pathway protein G